MNYLKVVLESLDKADGVQPVHGVFSLEAAGREVALTMSDLKGQTEVGAQVSGCDFFVVDAAIVDADRMASRLAQIGPTLLLEPGAAPLSLIADTLSIVGDVQGLHIIAGGSESELCLGGVSFSASNIAETRAEWAWIGGALAPDASVLIYSHLSRRSAVGQQWLQATSESLEKTLLTSNDLMDGDVISQAS